MCQNLGKQLIFCLLTIVSYDLAKFTYFSNFFVSSLGFSSTLLFLLWMESVLLPPFESYVGVSSYLIAPPRTSDTMVNDHGKSGYSCLTPNLRRKTLSFTIKFDNTCRFFMTAFCQVDEVPFYSSILRGFYFLKKVHHEWVLHIIICFYNIYLHHHMGFQL